MFLFVQCKLLKGTLFSIIAIGLLALTCVISHEASAITPYDGSKGVLTFALGHAYSSELPAIQNITRYNFTGNISPVGTKIGTLGYMTQADLMAYNSVGWEILSHSMTHPNIDNNTSSNVLQYEIVQSKKNLSNIGICANGYESPFDIITANSSVFIKNNYKFTVINPNKQNTVYSITHDGSNWNFPIAVHYSGVGNGNPIHDFVTAKAAIDYAVNNHTYLILNFHQIDLTTNPYATPPSLFWQILQYAKQKSDAGQLLIENSGQALGITCIPGLQVTPSPPGNATYSLPQTVTLTTSVPSTIYYTTDGSTPTTSSTNGPSPISGITISTNSTLKFFAKDSLGVVGPIGSAKYTVFLPVVVQMNDIVPSAGWNTYSGFRSIQAEYISANSTLVGKSINNMVVNLKRTGVPIGTVNVGVFNNDQSVNKLFGTINVSNIPTTTFTQYSFSLPQPESYQIQPGDRIGIQFNGGNSSNFILAMTDLTNSFDGMNSYQSWYTNNWFANKTHDLWMILKSNVSDSDLAVSVQPPGGTYTSSQSVTLSTSIPSTVYYTTDGTIPTISSPSGSSPVSGIPVNTNSTLKFFAKESQGDVGPIGFAPYVINTPIVTQMNDTTSSFGLSVNSIRPIQAEYLSANSTLVGKSIDNIVVSLRKVGLPNGTVQVGIFNSDQSLKKLFGTISPINIGTSGYAQYSFSLPALQKYQMQQGDRIGIKFVGGNATNFVSVMTDQTNSFDGIKSYLTYYYNSAWQSITGSDLRMTLKLHL